MARSVADFAGSPAMRARLQWFRRERDWINDQHLKLCRIPAPTFFEGKRAAWMSEQFQTLGWEARLDRAGNVVATFPGNASAAVAVTAHLDTVLAPRTPEDIRLLGDGRLAGPGVADNGAGLTALLALAAAWKAAPPVDGVPAAPMLVANVGEEGEGNLSGMRYFCRPGASQPRAFLVLDGPGTGHITSRALASQRFEVTITGPGGHSWRDSGRGNPVHALSHAVALFTARAGPLMQPVSLETAAADGPPAGPRSSFNFGIFEGGSSINSIPNEARAKIDLRSESLERIDEMAGLLTQAVEQAVDTENARSSGPRVAARIKEIGSRPSGELANDAPMLEALRAVDAHLGIRSRLDCSSTDANIPLSLGWQAASIGAGGHGGGAHTPAEWYLPDGRDLALRRILLAVCVLLAGE